MKNVEITQAENQYKGLPRVLHGVRYTQHLLAIVAEVLILLSFAMSGMDISLGGIMADMSQLKWAWAAAFALGIDTSFVIAWVRVRQCVIARQWGAFAWNILLALGLSFVVFQPVAVQMLQQSLSLSFVQALNQLGINLVILVYARALVAVLLGAILAMTNVESAMKDSPLITSAQPKRRVILFEKVLNRIAPIVDEVTAQPAQIEQSVITLIEQPLSISTQPQQEIKSEVTAQFDEAIEHPVLTQDTEPLPAQMVKQIDIQHSTQLSIVPLNGELTPVERVRQALFEQPDAGYNELGRLTGLAPATAKKYRTQIEQLQSQAV